MDKSKTTPKDFFLWAGAMVSLFGSVVAFLTLIFDYLNYAFPDPLSYYASNPYQNGVAYEMSTLIILGILCLVLLRVIHRSIEKDPTRADIWVRRWALYLTLFVAGAAIAIDLIVLLTSFLNGEELTISFLLKVALVLLVAAAGFMHFFADLRGYWTQNPKLSVRVTWGVAVLVVLTVATGFLVLGTPWQAREYQLDAQRITDLENIQLQIVTYWQEEGVLPSQLSDLTDSISGYSVPVDPETNQSYEYRSTGTTAFELCATFGVSGSGEGSVANPEPASFNGGTALSDDWSHGVGQTCFDRTIDPQKYPSASATPATGQE